MKNKALWQRIEAVEFSDPKASLDFVGRLMRENQWTRAFALAAIEEYKRFAYLAMVCEHEVTPSDEVDQVWHLHLQYSRHYWGEWTTEVLGDSLHHGPTIGGAGEASRFEKNYALTLASYGKEFSEQPPADLWPEAEIRFSRPLRMVRMDRQEYQWKPRNWTTLAAVMKVAVVIIIAIVAFNVIKNQMDEDARFFVIGFVLVVAWIVGKLLCSAVDSFCELEQEDHGRRRDLRRGGAGGSGCTSGEIHYSDSDWGFGSYNESGSDRDSRLGSADNSVSVSASDSGSSGGSGCGSGCGS